MLHAKAKSHALCLQMAKRHGQSVGGIRRLGSHVHREQSANHDLYLPFVRVAVAGNVGFDLARRVAMNFQAMLRCRQKHHAAHFREAKSGAHIERRKNTLDSQYVGRKILDESANQLMNFLQACA